MILIELPKSGMNYQILLWQHLIKDFESHLDNDEVLKNVF